MSNSLEITNLGTRWWKMTLDLVGITFAGWLRGKWNAGVRLIISKFAFAMVVRLKNHFPTPGFNQIIWKQCFIKHHMEVTSVYLSDFSAADLINTKRLHNVKLICRNDRFNYKVSLFGHVVSQIVEIQWKSNLEIGMIISYLSEMTGYPVANPWPLITRLCNKGTTWMTNNSIRNSVIPPWLRGVWCYDSGVTICSQVSWILADFLAWQARHIMLRVVVCIVRHLLSMEAMEFDSSSLQLKLFSLILCWETCRNRHRYCKNWIVSFVWVRKGVTGSSWYGDMTSIFTS